MIRMRPVLGEIQHRRRWRSVPVARFLERHIELTVVAGRGDLSVDHQPLIHVRNVAGLDLQVDAQVDGGTMVA